ncbi:uncharacterized protein LACBIDRAFT_334367 [Laccaria bicolor S238N-H82]|uniref:Predicted protein n=1 Tax=Laccaria bicolor (strain S238N-H82 / ATCC MYA-4686) TaxID=486041 RepID=B0DYZ7_LACBS|nr:uncharacterized protein LACBIDRAFT_334367 [Laccaria bicolor S238N-H82]EDR00144.1 predicted protein [Laccaria bicolor S238N-H82]|eukprot:XP_001889201.1 predicted protein [Laccaria bicolor S238N-H82]
MSMEYLGYGRVNTPLVKISVHGNNYRLRLSILVGAVGDASCYIRRATFSFSLCFPLNSGLGSSRLLVDCGSEKTVYPRWQEVILEYSVNFDITGSGTVSSNQATYSIGKRALFVKLGNTIGSQENLDVLRQVARIKYIYA